MYLSTVLGITEIELEIDQSGMGIYQVEVKGVCTKWWFWPNFQISHVFLAIAAEFNFVFDILLYCGLDVLDMFTIGFKIGNLVIEIY